MRSIIIKAIYSEDIFGNIGRMLGAFSLISLIRHGINISFSDVLLAIINQYDSIVDIILGWATPILQIIIDKINQSINIHLTLYEHWKHIFILIGIYLFREASSSYAIGFRVTSYFKTILSIIITTLTSIITGLLSLSSGNMFDQFFIAFIPILGIIIYDIIDNIWSVTFLREYWANQYHVPCPTWWSDFKQNLIWVAHRNVAAIAILIIGLQIPLIRHTDSPGVVMLTLLIFLMSFYWFWRGISNVKFVRRENDNWEIALWRTGYAHIGAAMLGVFFWVGVFTIANAGLRFYGM